MRWTPVKKPTGSWAKPPNLLDYDHTCSAFSWEDVRRELDGLPGGGGLNIAHEAVDRHAAGPLRNHPALRWLGSGDSVREFSFADLSALSNRFANLLRGLGVGRGDTVAVLAGRIPELYWGALGTLKNTSVFCPLFSAFGPEPVFQRLSRGEARVLLTTERQYLQKVRRQRDALPRLAHVLLVDRDDHPEPGVWSLPRLMAASSETFAIPPTDPEDSALLHFTSGTTGLPKGAIHVHNAVLTHYLTGKYVLDFHPGDVFWCTADPGWVTGTSYGIIAPLLHGITNIIDAAEFDAQRWCRILASQKVSVWYTTPTAIRRLMRLGVAPRREHDLSHLRLVHSVGEPLNPESVVWGQEALGLPIHDNWWQTETGGIMIANFPAMEIRPGSMGRPLPGITAAIVQRCDNAHVAVIAAPDVQGDLALRAGWPSMFRGYLHENERYLKCFADGWYLTGDLARRDADGYFWFVGRADDIIKTSGHMVGPFEVESILMEHPAVAEAGVIGKPDPLIGELVKAFVALKPGVLPQDDLRLELIGFARQKLGTAVAPKEIEFMPDLPKNKAGKIMRRLLKARELGLPEGDPSALSENGSAADRC
ncbi:MAG: acetate--CoA ligase [Desulfobacterales bacterium]